MTNFARVPWREAFRSAFVVPGLICHKSVDHNSPFGVIVSSAFDEAGDDRNRKPIKIVTCIVDWDRV
jgi:hypothetical protein